MLTRCFPIPAAILSSSLPHRIMVRLAHHRALRVLPYIVCGEGSDVWWSVFGWTCIASQGGCVWEATFKGEKKEKEKKTPKQELLVGPIQSSKAKSHLRSCQVCKQINQFDRFGFEKLCFLLQCFSNVIILAVVATTQNGQCRQKTTPCTRHNFITFKTCSVCSCPARRCRGDYVHILKRKLREKIT